MGAQMGKVTFVNAGRLGADAGIRGLGLRVRGALVLFEVTGYA
jgi:hypothetical protein